MMKTLMLALTLIVSTSALQDSAEAEVAAPRVAAPAPRPGRRLLNSPTRSPTISMGTDCYLLPEGDPNNLANSGDFIMIANSGTGRAKVDNLDNSGDDVENTEAQAFCTARFGGGSKPVSPVGPNKQAIWDAMVYMCQNKGLSGFCWMGLSRGLENYDGVHAHDDCDTLHDYAGAGSASSVTRTDIDAMRGTADWGNVDCAWSGSSFWNHNLAKKRHCLQHNGKTDADGDLINMYNCNNANYYIICTYEAGSSCTGN